eukprot:COSAG06_NODE_45631_length_353_cov_0.803150_1_plen_81_part_10
MSEWFCRATDATVYQQKAEEGRSRPGRPGRRQEVEARKQREQKAKVETEGRRQKAEGRSSRKQKQKQQRTAEAAEEGRSSR